MSAGYRDDHRFLLYQGQSCRDITEVVSDAELRDEADALSVEVRFTVLRNHLTDRYAHWYGIQPGDKLRISNHGAEVFAGVILSVGQDGAVTANDPGWYLTKSQIVLQLTSATAPDAVRRMCAKTGIPEGMIDLPPIRISKVWFGATPESILQDILDICAAETGTVYLRRVRQSALQVYPRPDTVLTLYHRPAANLSGFDVTLAKGEITGGDSMENMVNSVVLTDGSGKSGRVLGRAYNAASIGRFGLLQQAESLDGDENTAQARQRIRTLLAKSDRIARERTVDNLFGDDAAVSGALVTFAPNRYDVSGRLRIVDVTHRYGPTHLMSVTVAADQTARAAGGEDTVNV